MNIFVVHRNPRVAARMLADRHVVKMTLESAQLLSTALWLNGVEGPYRPNHQRHPCAIWVAESNRNFEWLYSHALELSREYTYRYGRIHSCDSVIRHTARFVLHLPFSRRASNHPLCMPEQYKTDCPVQSYRAYYNGAKGWARWTRRAPPSWWKG